MSAQQCKNKKEISKKKKSTIELIFDWRRIFAVPFPALLCTPLAISKGTVAFAHSLSAETNQNNEVLSFFFVGKLFEILIFEVDNKMLIVIVILRSYIGMTVCSFVNQKESHSSSDYWLQARRHPAKASHLRA